MTPWSDHDRHPRPRPRRRHPLDAARPAGDPPDPRRPHHRFRADRRLSRAQRPATRPVWFMRQAGRSLPEYRTVRGATGMLEACLTPDLATEITLQPVRRHRVDAAILFSDIVVPLKLAGIDVEIVPGTGPVVAHPVRTAADVAALPPLDPGGPGTDHRGRGRDRAGSSGRLR